MNLILWRHAEAEEGCNDLARQLTAKGHKQASQMAHWLREHLPTDHLVIASEAARSQQTAQALTDRQVIRPEINPGEPAQSLLVLCGQHHAGETLVIVGHQPTLGRAAAWLLTGHEQDWSVKKSAIWWLAARTRFGERQTVLRAVLGPDHL